MMADKLIEASDQPVSKAEAQRASAARPLEARLLKMEKNRTE